MFVKFLLFFAILLVISFVMEKYLKKKFSIPKRDTFIYHRLNNIQRWGERIIFILFVITLWVFIDHSLIVLIIYVLLFHLYRGFMEWKYNREGKQYILTIAFIVLYLIMISLLFFVYQT
ncbi:MAG: DUF4181 domain-containing protein [Bacillus sp. (in: firmicutes)]